MSRSVAYRCAWLAGLLLLLALSACRGTTATPGVSLAASPTQGPPKAEASLVASPTEPTPTPSPAPSATKVAAHPTETPQSPAPAVMPATDLPFPTLLRTLNFGVPAGNSYSPSALAVHPDLGRLYVLTLDNGPYGRRHGLVTVLDLVSGEVLSVTETGFAEGTDRALAVDTLRNRVYVDNDRDKTCLVLDTMSLEPVATIEDVLNFALDQVAGRLYVAGPHGLRTLDLAGYRLLRQNAISFSGEVPDMAVDPAKDRVYVAHFEVNGFVLDQYDAGTLRRVATTSCPNGCRAVLPDPARDRVYLTVGDSADSLWAVDEEGMRVEGVSLGEPGSYHALALDAAGDRLFAAGEPWSNAGIAVIDLQTGRQVGAIAADPSVEGMVWDAEHGRLWFSMRDRVGFGDPATGQVGATGPLAIDLDTAQLVVGGNQLYLTDSTRTLHILDTTTYEELTALPVSGDLTLDPAHNRLYITSWDSSEGSVAVVDTPALTVTQILTPGGTVGWDPERNRLYVGMLGRGGQVYDTLTLEKLRNMPIGGKVVYNPLRDELLIVAHTVYRADPETLELIGDLLPDISAQECPECEGVPFASDAEVLADRNLLEITIAYTGRGGGCGTPARLFDATTLESITGPTEARPCKPTCNSRRGLSEPILDRVYKGLWCGTTQSYRNLFVYDLQGSLLSSRTGIDSGLINANTCQGYITRADDVLVLDLPSLTPAGTLPGAAYTVDAERGRVYGLAGAQVLVYAETGGRPDPPLLPAETGPLPAERITWLEASPGFAQDSTIFAGLPAQGQSTTDPSEIFRSTDGGASWARLRGGLPEGSSLTAAVSPGFASDRTLFAGGYNLNMGELGDGVLRSTDGGDTWQPVWDGLSDLAVQSLALSPEYGSDGTLLAYSASHDLLHYTQFQRSVSRSTDRGLHWTLVATGTLPPPEELLPPDPHSPDLRFRAGYGGVDRWTAEVGAWQPTFRIPDQGGPVQAVLPSPNVSSDGTLYVLTQAGLFRSVDRGDSWSRCPEGRLDGRDHTSRVMAGCWAGEQIAAGTANGEVLFVDPAALECESIEATTLWPSVLAGSWVNMITAEPQDAAGGSQAGGVWLGGPWRLHRYAGGKVQSRNYTAADGLPDSGKGMAVTPAGVLWVGGSGDPDVASFDGQTWTPHSLPMLEASGWVQDLAAGHDGTVWAVTEPPGVYRWTGSVWEVLPDPPSHLGESVNAIAVAPDGSPWVATSRGLAHYAQSRWISYDLGECTAVAAGPTGDVYGLTSASLVWRFVEGVWTTLPSAGSEFIGPSTLYGARDRSLWIGTARGAFRYDGQAWRQFPPDIGLPGNDVEAIAEDADGELWFGTSNGAARVDPAELGLSTVLWPAPLPLPFPAVAPSPTPWPSSTPMPVLDASHVAERFAPAYADPWIATRLGRPREEADTTQAAFQAFEHGLMIWRGDTKQIYALHDDGSLAYYNDTWDESQPVDDSAQVPPDGFFQPVRGFGKLWRTEVRLASKLGWALAPEQGYDMLIQWFEGGTMLLGPQGEVYVLLPFWTWERR